MFLVDCTELNDHLRAECNELIEILLKSISEFCLEKSNNIGLEFETIKEKVSAKIDTEDKLVATEEYLDLVKQEGIDKLTKDYEDLLLWLMMLLDTRYVVKDDDLKKIWVTFSW